MANYRSFCTIMYDILLLSIISILIAKCSCPARTTKRRILDICSLCLTTSHFVHIIFRYHYISPACFECVIIHAPNLTKDDEPNDRLGIAAALPLHPRFALYKYRLSYSRMPTPTLLLSQKNTAPCGAAHFLR